MPSLVNEWFYLSSARFLLVKTVQYSSQRRGTPNLHLLSHPLTLRRCNLSNESNCIVCRDAPLEFLNLPWCPSPVTGIAVVPSLTQTFPRQELQCPMTNEIRPLHIDNKIVESMFVIVQDSCTCVSKIYKPCFVPCLGITLSLISLIRFMI